jgi:sugar lactone lactonase YvrE
VPVYDFGEQGDLTYLVMPYLPGGTLRDLLAKRSTIPLAEALAMSDQMADALDYAHERGLIHRDVKPANILLNDEGQALLSDFGIVRLVQKEDAATTLTQLGAFIGSPEYAAPEIGLGGPIDLRADVYSLGVVLFRMLTGQLPFVGSSPVQLLMQHAQQPPPLPRSLNPAIPPAVEAVLLKALAKQPAERYQTAAELRAALRAAQTMPAQMPGEAGTPAIGTIGSLPTVVTPAPPPAPAPGPLAAPLPGPVMPPFPGQALAPTHGGPETLTCGPTAAPTSGPAGFAPASGPAATPPLAGMGPNSGAAQWSIPGNGAPQWSIHGNTPMMSPPTPPTFATGLASAPQETTLAGPTAKRRPQRRLLAAMLLALLLIGSGFLALRGFASKAGGPAVTATGTPVGTKVTATLPPAPPAGIVTEFLVPTDGSTPTAITAGPDGALWFTEGRGNKIGRLLPGMSINEFAAFSAKQAYGQGITSGPDGNVWFTGPVGSDNYIGRIMPDGTISRFTVPTRDAGPVGITLGPDGNLWFTESDSHKIGRITPEGAITEFAVPIAQMAPFYLVAGPDGNLWFTDPGTNSIGRMTLGGKFSEFALLTAQSNPNNITKGPDGNLWFTENTSNKIGRITRG